MDFDGVRRFVSDSCGFCGLADKKFCRISGLGFLADLIFSSLVKFVNCADYLRLTLEISKNRKFGALDFPGGYRARLR